MQAVLSMAILDEIKVYDKDGKIKENKTLLDSLNKDEKGVVKLDKDVEHTSLTKLASWDKGGRAIISSVIKTKIFQVFGNYDSNLQPEIMKHPVGSNVKAVGIFSTLGPGIGVAEVKPGRCHAA